MLPETERPDYKFTVKEAFGEAWIMLEPMRGDLSILKGSEKAWTLYWRSRTPAKESHRADDL